MRRWCGKTLPLVYNLIARLFQYSSLKVTCQRSDVNIKCEYFYSFVREWSRWRDFLWARVIVIYLKLDPQHSRNQALCRRGDRKEKTFQRCGFTVDALTRRKRNELNPCKIFNRVSRRLTYREPTDALNELLAFSFVHTTPWAVKILLSRKEIRKQGCLIIAKIVFFPRPADRAWRLALDESQGITRCARGARQDPSKEKLTSMKGMDLAVPFFFNETGGFPAGFILNLYFKVYTELS